MTQKASYGKIFVKSVVAILNLIKCKIRKKENMFLYIDPGTGSMLFTILIGVLSAAVYFFRSVFLKLRFFMGAGKAESASKDSVPFVIFTDDKRYWNVFKPICDEMEKRGEPLSYLTASSDDPALSENYEYIKTEFIGYGNKAFAFMNTLKADLVLSSTPGLDVYQWKRSRDVNWYVHIPHAASDITLYRMFGIDYFDAVLLSGEYQRKQIRALETLRSLPEKDLPLVGIGYMDSMKQRLEASPELHPHHTTVLVAPSWGPSAILSKYGSEIIDELLKTDYKIIIRPHPQSFISEKQLIEILMAEYPNSDKLTWDRSNDNFEVLREADILISDFSGIIFDFALVFDKPVIYADTSFDKGPYDAWWLNEELWTFETLPKIGVQLSPEALPQIGNIIDNSLNSLELKAGRATARSETWCNIGNAASAAADYLIDTRKHILEISQN